MQASTPIRQQFVRFLFPGSFLVETADRLIEHHDPMRVVVPKNAFCFQFVTRLSVTVTEGAKKYTLIGGEELEKKTYYKGGKAYTLAEVKDQFPTEKTLISNMEINN